MGCVTNRVSTVMATASARKPSPSYRTGRDDRDPSEKGPCGRQSAPDQQQREYQNGETAEQHILIITYVTAIGFSCAVIISPLAGPASSSSRADRKDPLFNISCGVESRDDIWTSAEPWL